MRRTTLRLVCSLLAAAALACGSDGSGSASVDAGPGSDGGGGGFGNADASIDDVPDRLTYIDTLTIPEVSGGTPACCYDFGDISKNGAGEQDNALAVLSDSISAFVDFQPVLDETLESGDQVLLLNHVGLTGPDDSFRMDALQGDFAEGTTYTEASAGTGSFVIDPSSYDGSGNALISLTGGLTGNAMAVGPGDFSFQIPFGATVLSATVLEARISGTATLEETAASYSGGELSGYILVDELFAGLNAFASTCTCLGLEGDLFTKTDGEWDGNCVEGASELCPQDPDCAQIAGTNVFDSEFCTLLPGFIQSSADIDTNNDTTIYEGLSVGFEWTGQNAAIAP